MPATAGEPSSAIASAYMPRWISTSLWACSCSWRTTEGASSRASSSMGGTPAHLTGSTRFVKSTSSATAAASAEVAAPARLRLAERRKPTLEGTRIASQYRPASSCVHCTLSGRAPRRSAPWREEMRLRPQMCESTPTVRWTDASLANSAPTSTVLVVWGKPAGTYSICPGVSTVSTSGSRNSEGRSISSPFPRASGSAAGIRRGGGGSYTRQRFAPHV
mmetsp:Transcript_22785/g.52510  ORF Transcript_22785/g.52510 Transcript_22785/m.52510 type:complete len:219 (+) Transcript_22785:553-1209(+)